MKSVPPRPTLEQLKAENADLRARLEEAEETLRAIREGEVDAVIVSGSKGDRVYALEEADNLARRMVETMNEAGLAVTPEGMLVFCNTQAAILLGRPKEHLLGRNLGEFVVPEDAERYVLLLRSSWTTVADARIAFVAPPGAPIPMHLWASRLDRSEGPLICLVATDLRRIEADRQMITQLEETNEQLRQARVAALNLMRDAVDAREQMDRATTALRKSEEKYRHLVEHSPTAIYEIDFVANRFVTVNDGMCRMLGYTEAELLGMNPGDLLDEESSKVFMDRIRQAQAGEKPPPFIEYKVKRKDGCELWGILHTAYHFKGNKIVGALVVAHDITERRRAEEALRRQNEELERFNRAMVDRELRMIELKKQINELSEQVGHPKPYPLEFEGK